MSIIGMSTSEIPGFGLRGMFRNGDITFARKSGLASLGNSYELKNIISKGGLYRRRDGITKISTIQGEGKVRGYSINGSKLFIVVGDELKYSNDSGLNFVNVGVVKGEVDTKVSLLHYGDYVLIANKGQLSPQLYEINNNVLRDLTRGSPSIGGPSYEWYETITIDKEPTLVFYGKLQRTVISIGSKILCSKTTSKKSDEPDDFGITYQERFKNFVDEDLVSAEVGEDIINTTIFKGQLYCFSKTGIFRYTGQTAADSLIDYLVEEHLETQFGIAGNNSVLAIGDNLFIITSLNTFAAFGFLPGIEGAVFQDLTTKIIDFLEEELDDDQSKSFIQFSKKNNLIHFFYKKKGNTGIMNTISMEFGQESIEFYPFEFKKEFDTSFIVNKKTLITCDNEIYQIEQGNNDDGDSIEYLINLGDISLSFLSHKILFRQFVINGLIDDINKINVKILFNGNEQNLNDKVIIKKLVNSDSNGNKLVKEVDGSIVKFNKVFPFSEIWNKANYINFIISGESEGGNIGIGGIEYGYTSTNKEMEFSRSQKY